MIVYQDGHRTAVLTGLNRDSENRKTGPMAQLWILATRQVPTEAARNGHDRLVCGDCPLRPTVNGGCYVNLSRASHHVWRKLRRGGYPLGMPERIDRPLRLGAYGDPAFLPLTVISQLVNRVRRWTGYTHQWRDPARQGLREYCMASVESEDAAKAAWAAGWRTFRILRPGQTEVAGEIRCPAENGKTTCAKCGLCHGTGPLKSRKSITIMDHGPRRKRK